MQRNAINYVRPFFLVFLLVSIARDVRAQQDEQTALKGRVMRELPGALARLEGLYSRVSVSGILTEEVRFRRLAEHSPQGDKEARQLTTERPLVDLESTWSRNVSIQASGALKKTFQSVIFDKYYDKDIHALRDRKATPQSPSRSVACLRARLLVPARFGKGHAYPHVFRNYRR